MFLNVGMEQQDRPLNGRYISELLVFLYLVFCLDLQQMFQFIHRWVMYYWVLNILSGVEKFFWERCFHWAILPGKILIVNVIWGCIIHRWDSQNVFQIVFFVLGILHFVCRAWLESSSRILHSVLDLFDLFDFFW